MPEPKEPTGRPEGLDAMLAFVGDNAAWTEAELAQVEAYMARLRCASLPIEKSN